MSDDPIISYSVKELLTAMDRKLDAALTTLMAKADSSRVDALEKDVTYLMQHHRSSKESASLRAQWRQWLYPLLVSVVLTVATIISLFH